MFNFFVCMKKKSIQSIRYNKKCNTNLSNRLKWLGKAITLAYSELSERDFERPQTEIMFSKSFPFEYTKPTPLRLNEAVYLYYSKHRYDLLNESKSMKLSKEMREYLKSSINTLDQTELRSVVNYFGV